MSYQDYLSKFDGEWNKAEKPENTYADIPDGKYIVNIETAKIDENDSQRVFLKFGLRIAKGDFSRRLIFKKYYLDNPDKFGYLKDDLSKIGFELQKISDLPELLPNLTNRIMEVNLSTSKPKEGQKPFQGCYFSKFISMFGESTDEADGINLDDLDI
jgi:hypothetical protein